MAVTVLLDTNALLWSLLEPHKLSPSALTTVKDPETVLLVSSASAWELGIKHKLGKLTSASGVIADFPGHLKRLQANVLPGNCRAARLDYARICLRSHRPRHPERRVSGVRELWALDAT